MLYQVLCAYKHVQADEIATLLMGAAGGEWTAKMAIKGKRRKRLVCKWQSALSKLVVCQATMNVFKKASFHAEESYMSKNGSGEICF